MAYSPPYLIELSLRAKLLAQSERRVQRSEGKQSHVVIFLAHNARSALQACCKPAHQPFGFGWISAATVHPYALDVQK
jgi:hypothetical protein